ncbi:MAG: chemotaxis protein CheA [Desulfotignum sp.]
MNHTDASQNMAFTIEDRDAFLQLAGDFLQINNELPEILSNMDDDSDKTQIEQLASKISRFSTAVQLMGATPLLPSFDALEQLIQNICTDRFTQNADIPDLIIKISGLLASHFHHWEKILAQNKTKLFRNLVFQGDEALLAAARSVSSKKHLIDFSEEFDLNAHLSPDMVDAYVHEGLSFVAAIQSDLLVRSEQETFAVEELHQTLSMLKGNSEVLADQSRLDLDLFHSHPLGKISGMAEGMLRILDTFLADDAVLASDTANLFVTCCDALPDLFTRLEQAKMPGDHPDTLLDKLDDHYHNRVKKKQPPSIPTAASEPPGEGAAGKGSEQTFISIRLERIETLGNLIGELVVAKNSFNNLRILMDQGDKTAIDGFLKKTEDSFHRIISDLDNVVMKMRMQKIKTLFQRFPRMVRDLSKKMDKDIELVFSGQDTEIDNRILGAITDPLMHLVRNALDHGVETTAQRQQTGKDEKGMIRLSARNQDGRTVIEIFDNGRGIDPEVLKKKAVEKNLLEPQDADKLSDQEARELIFMPGFSTAEQVTDVSGRGVGMDVVVSNIKQINGTLSIESEKNRFTKVTLSLPSSISVSKGLKVCLENDPYMIPMDVITKMIFVERSNIHQTGNTRFVEKDGAIYPVLHINQMMGYRSPFESDSDIINLVVIKKEQKAVCVAVDKIMGIEDIVIKPLPVVYARLDKWFSGCTILSDGNIVLILNMNNFLEQGNP